ncbi:MAG: uroporphyrinogen decarboxylase family protein [Actinomycetota bacterium]|nr:uroporphyrinogen decarboxylase family protein [Actinomycetota bacterium]
MDSRERVKITLNHKIPDRAPIDFGSTRTSGITTIAYNRLIKEINSNKEPNALPRMYDMVQQLAYPQSEILKLFNVDFIDAGQAFYESEDFWKEFVLNNGSKCLIPSWFNVLKDKNGNVIIQNDDGIILGKMPKSSLYVDQIYWVYGNSEKIPEKIDPSDFDKDVWAYTTPPPGSIDLFDKKQAELFKNSINKLYENTDYAIVLRFGGNLVESGFSIRGMENYLCDLYLDQSGVNRFLDTLMDDYVKKLNRVLELVADKISVIMFADDMGSELGPFFPQEIYRKYFKKRHSQMWSIVHEKSDCKVFLHTCGSVSELLPDLIDAGLDILNPVQISAKNMDPEILKKNYGKDLIFWGGCCDTREILPKASPEKIKEHVRQNMKILGKDGGLVFNQIHNIQPEVPPSNILALFEAAHLYGKY